MLGTTNIVAFVPTRDAEKARAFYESVLGLRFVKDDGFAMVLDANGIMVRVAKVQAFTPAQFTILGWEVHEIEKVVSRLQERGVGDIEPTAGSGLEPASDLEAVHRSPRERFEDEHVERSFEQRQAFPPPSVFP